ncbi:hypothetical protein [Sphingomonas turrisvirgatae]|uniref:Uncharacterized protein n=1 Tax=Sphingomonas turrisvirgatae TaxID=1888892 RepID=A0A1E3LUH6_9SPHN|nr:hypothetical protein [Sphingomonas turrisvirgatae]ODP37384.1 hypothetical protein BFL28_18075 [Sphingomonas turrisvirgatae]
MSDNVVPFRRRPGVRARAVDAAERAAFLAAAGNALAQVERDRLLEVWTSVGHDVPGGPYYVVLAVHRGKGGFEISSSGIFVRIAGYSDAEIALTAAEIVADHFGVEAVDHVNAEPEGGTAA